VTQSTLNKDLTGRGQKNQAKRAASVEAVRIEGIGPIEIQIRLSGKIMWGGDY